MEDSGKTLRDLVAEVERAMEPLGFKVHDSFVKVGDYSTLEEDEVRIRLYRRGNLVLTVREPRNGVGNSV